MFPKFLIDETWLVTRAASLFQFSIPGGSFSPRPLIQVWGNSCSGWSWLEKVNERGSYFMIFHKEMSHRTVISLLPISVNALIRRSVRKPKNFFKHSRRKCMVGISDCYINTFTARHIHYVPVKQNWQLLERGQLSYLTVIMTWHNSCLSLGEQEKEEQ